MNRFARYAGRLKWLVVSFTLAAFTAGAALAKDQPVASVAQLAAENSSSGVNPIAAINPIASNTDCTLQNNVKRKGTTDGKPAIRTALYTWSPVALKRSLGGRADTTPDARIMEATRERSKKQTVLAGGSLGRPVYAATIAAAKANTNGKHKDTMPSRPYAGQATGWLRMLRPTPARVVICGNTIEA